MKRPFKAIKDNCIECCGDSTYEVVLCQIRDCNLWPYRLGVRPSSPVYHKRVTAAWEKDNEQVKELRDLGLDLPDFLIYPIKRRVSRKKSGFPISRGRKKEFS